MWLRFRYKISTKRRKNYDGSSMFDEVITEHICRREYLVQNVYIVKRPEFKSSICVIEAKRGVD